LKLLGALVFLHSQGVLHADIKPDNIMVDEETTRGLPCIKLIDFSNSMHFEEAHAYHDTFDVASLSYRAPELIYGTEFDFSIDIWAAGITIAELFCGRTLIHPSSREGLATQLAELFGQPPDGLFDGGKFATQLLARVVNRPRSFGIHEMRQRLSAALGATGTQEQLLLLDLLSQILRYDPRKRLRPCEALCHPFFAPVFPFKWMIANALQSPCRSANRSNSDVAQDVGWAGECTLLLRSDCSDTHHHKEIPNADQEATHM